jgi:hypothetical protein
VLLGVCLVPTVQRSAGAIVAGTAAEVLRWSTGRAVEWSLTERSIKLTIAASDDSARGSMGLIMLGHVRNLPLFLAIVFAAGKLRSRRSMLLVALVAMAILVMHGVIAAHDAWTRFPIEVRPPTNGVYGLLAVLSVSHTTGGVFAGLVVLAALSLVVMDRARGGADPARLGPNDRCSCGSGLKWKRCCRATANALDASSVPPRGRPP